MKTMGRTTCLTVLLVALTTFPQCRGEDNSMRYNSPGHVAKTRAQILEDHNEHVLDVAQRFLGDDIQEEDLNELGLFKKAILDPMCDNILDCSDTNNRKFVNQVEYPTFTGQCNNEGNFSWGMAGVQHVRLVPHAYDNPRWAVRNFSSHPGSGNVALPHPRTISNIIHRSDGDKDATGDSCTLALFYFMQFIDHDIIKTPNGNVNTNNINCCETPTRQFCMVLYMNETDDQFEQGYCMELRRSDTVFRCNDDSRFQNQYNEITAYIDGSMIYGSSEEESANLRTNIGGELKVENQFMPTANESEDCTVTFPYKCFAAGDTRNNVHPGLTTYHTIFVREHNRIARVLSAAHINWSDERIFMETRKIVAAQIQHIVYNEMLPAVLDSSYLNQESCNISAPYVYNSTMDASIFQGFSIAYRYHHLMPSTFHKASYSNDEVTNTFTQDQFEAYTKPSHLLDDNYAGIDKISLGLAHNKCPVTNGRVNDDARDKLFDNFDLAAINILRGREWGTPSYTVFRKLCGVGDATTWTDLNNTHSEEEIDKLQSVYLNVTDVDLWTGVTTETKVGNSISGPTQSCLVAMQFCRLKRGDRFWFENSIYGFETSKANEIKKVTLARVLCDNTNNDNMRTDVFNSTSAWTSCDSLPSMNLTLW